MCIVAAWLSRHTVPAALRRFAMATAIFFLLAGITIVPYTASRLLTLGYHQRRAEDVPAGTTAIALGGGDRSDWSDWVPETRTLAWSGRVIRETGGIAYYWLRGWWRR